MRGPVKRFSLTEVTRIKNKLKPREKQFCVRFVCTGNAEESARKAGYEGDCAEKGAVLMCDERILEEISRLLSLRRSVLGKLATAGYYRLAFGGVSDALRLLYMDDPTGEELAKMDLFMISEIKKPKDGMLEIKFFDRLRALEKLESGAGGDLGVTGLYEAIGRGAQAAGVKSDDQ